MREIKMKNLLHDKWYTTQLENMVKWYKKDGDNILPTKKQDLLDHYLAS